MKKITAKNNIIDVSKDTSMIYEQEEVNLCSKCNTMKHMRGDICANCILKEIEDEPKYEEAQMEYLGYEDVKTGKFITPSSSLEDKIIEEFDSKFNGWILQDDQEFYRSFEVVTKWLKSQLSLYRQQLLQEYDNNFRMGYEAGRREMLEEVKEKVWESKNKLTMKWDNDKIKSLAYDDVLYNILSTIINKI